MSMSVMDMLSQSGGIEAISRQLGIPPAMAAAGAEAMLPAILGGFARRSNASGGSEEGLGGLIGMLGSLGGGTLAENVLGPDETNVGMGNDVLGQIFGSKDVSRTVASHASGQTGIDPALLKKMLPLLAMLVGGYLSSRASGTEAANASDGGGLGGALGSILGSVMGGSTAPAGSAGGLGSLIDFNHDGNPLDDIINMAGKLIR
jgi:hypothetical protein